MYQFVSNSEEDTMKFAMKIASILKKGDIIAYSNGKLIIVHRIKKINGTGKNTTYVMKGDANNGNDPRDINKSQIKGRVVYKIPVIAWPTVWLTELFNS